MRAPEPLPVTTCSPRALDAIHRFGGELLSHGCHANAILEAVLGDPECAAAHAYAAVLFLTQTTRTGRIQAAPHIAAARAMAGGATPREGRLVAAVAAWGDNDAPRAARLLADIVAQWPHDVVSAKLAQILQLACGDVAAMVRTASIAAAADAAGFASGLLAFALEQQGDIDRAETLARCAIDRHPLTDPWAQHAMAHVLCAREDWAAGRAFLRAHAESWDRCSSFMLTHNWWHAALCALRLGDREGALHLFDTRVWGVRKGHSQDQINAVSLLSRLEIFGVDGGARWTDLACHAAPLAGEGISDFAELHYLYALVRAGRDADAETVLNLMRHKSTLDPDSPVGGIAEGLVAHARGQFYAAAVALGQGRHWHARIGGSQVQRQWLDELMVDSLARLRGEGQRACA